VEQYYLLNLYLLMFKNVRKIIIYLTIEVTIDFIQSAQTFISYFIKMKLPYYYDINLD
jgi:hypothetical protein